MDSPIKKKEPKGENEAPAPSTRLPDNMTKLASIATRSTATQKTNYLSDGQWRSIQGKYWLEAPAQYPTDPWADP